MSAPPPAPASPSPEVEPSLLPPTLSTLAALLAQHEHLLATPDGHEGIATAGLESTTGLFDLGLSLEPSSHPHLHPLLQSLLTPSALTTRSKSQAQTTTTPAAPAPTSILPYTRSSGLYTSNMSTQQIWDQLELRAGVVGGLLKAIGLDLPGEEEDGMLGGPEEEEEESEEDDEEMDSEEEKEMREMMRMYEAGELGEGGIREDDEDDDDEDEDESDDEDEDEDGFGSEDDYDEEELMEGLEGEEDEPGPTYSRSKKLRLEEEEEDEMEMDEEMVGEMEDDEEEEDNEEEEDDEDDAQIGSFKPKKTHPTLDDRFFSIDEFNRLTEETEAGLVGSGKLSLGGDDEEEEDDEDELGGGVGGLEGMFGGEVDVEGDMMYSDFFAPPPRDRSIPRPRVDRAGGKNADKGKGKGKGKSFELMEEEEEEDDDEISKGKKSKGKGKEKEKQTEKIGDISEYGRRTMIRVRGDLFADEEDEEEEGKAPLSTHELRQRALAEQIAALESENVGVKDWVLLGEATARSRPENSLLEEELDFEMVGKVVPEVTEERVKGLEEIIKRRILDNNFDDIVRKREMDDKPFLPSRYFDLQDTQSAKSLAQIYEDEYTAASSGTAVVDPRDAKLKKEHEEIEKIWGEIGWKLDALSNLNYTPKQPKAAITTLSNISSTTLESALPTTQSTSTLLAPEELFAPPKPRSLVARSELLPDEKRRSRTKARKERMKTRQGLEGAVGKFAGRQGTGGGKARGGVKGEKDRALKELVKTGKGVTVVGKQPTKKRGEKTDTSTTTQAAKLKL